MMENSPRAIIVKPILVEALWDSPAFLPAIMPATKFPTMVSKAAPSDNQKAPANVEGSIFSPKLKKKQPQRNL